MTNYISERKKILIFAVVVMTITMAPYLIGYSTEGMDWSFTGFVIGVEDGNSYLAKMRSGMEGNWLFSSAHSAEYQKGVIAYLPYILLGKLAAKPASHEQLVALYHAARLFSGCLAILASYDFLSIYIPKPSHRFRALFLIVLGGGLGWLLVAVNQKGFLGSLPLEFISPETFGFLGLFGFPHLAAARALLLWGLTLYLQKEQGYYTGMIWLIMGFLQPMIVVLAWAVIGIYLAAVVATKIIPNVILFQIEDRAIKGIVKKTSQAVLISAPIVIYTAYIFLTDPYFKAWSEQNSFPSPHPIHYLFAYGLVIPFALIGIRKLIRSGNQAGLLLAGWVIIFPILVYAPVITQRRLAEGFWVVLIIGLLGNYLESEKIPLAVRVMNWLLLPSTVFLLAGSILQTSLPSEPIFRRNAEVAAYLFLADETPSGSIILSTFEIGNNLPAWAPVRVVMGHGPETIGLDRIKSDVNQYLNQAEGVRICSELFSKYKIDYLFWGPLEEGQWEMDPETLDCLKPVYGSQAYTIFEVEN